MTGGSVGSGTPYADTTTATTGEYALGQVTRSWTTNSETGTGAQTGIHPSDTEYSYAWHDGPVQTQIKYYADVHNRTTNDIDDTQFTLDAHGAVKTAEIEDGQPRDVNYVTDLSGQVVRRQVVPSSGDAPLEYYYRFGGREMGITTNDAGPQDRNLTYDASVHQRGFGYNHNTAGPFHNGSNVGLASHEFDNSYQAINSYNQGSVSGSYTVQGGESLASIASSLYGDGNLWYKIAQANGLSGPNASLSAGQTLTLPAGVMRNTYNAATFQPYNPGEAIGDVNPTAPEPPAEGGKCGAFGQFLTAIVSVAVTLALNIVVPGSGALYQAAVAAASSSASQGFAVATGIQEKFSWNAVGMAAIGGGVGNTPAMSLGPGSRSAWPG